jgi:hypothetical protein
VNVKLFIYASYLRQRFRQRFRVAGVGAACVGAACVGVADGIPVAVCAGAPAGACQADGAANRLERGVGFTSARYRRAVAPSCDFSISRMPK